MSTLKERTMVDSYTDSRKTIACARYIRSQGIAVVVRGADATGGTIYVLDPYMRDTARRHADMWYSAHGTQVA